MAFFFSGGAAWCTGRGEKVAPIRLGGPLTMVIVCPPVGSPRRKFIVAFACRRRRGSGAALRQAIEAGDVEEIGRRLHNRLQESAESLPGCFRGPPAGLSC